MLKNRIPIDDNLFQTPPHFFVLLIYIFCIMLHFVQEVRLKSNLVLVRPNLPNKTDSDSETLLAIGDTSLSVGHKHFLACYWS